MNQALLDRCRSLYNRARLGDASAYAQILAMKSRAKSGDLQSAICFNTMAVLHWQGQEGPKRPKWPRAEAFYRRLAQNDMAAWAAMTRIQKRAKAREEQAMRVFAMLKAIHNQYKASVWYPGAPRLSGYGLPSMNVAGISIPRQPLTREEVFGPTGILATIKMAIESAKALPGPRTPSTTPHSMDFEQAAGPADMGEIAPSMMQPIPGASEFASAASPAMAAAARTVPRRPMPMAPKPVVTPLVRVPTREQALKQLQKRGTPCDVYAESLKRNPKGPQLPYLKAQCEKFKKASGEPDYSRLIAARSRRSGM